MELRFLGTGAAFFPEMGNNGAFFVRGDDLYLLDCGESAFAKLHRSGLLTQYKGQLTILLTHMHSDHCGSLGTLVLYMNSILGCKSVIVHPNDEVRELLRLMGANESQYTLKPDLQADGLSITPIPIQHTPAVKAFAYLVKTEAETIYYSGDSTHIPPEILDGLRGGSIGRLYQDVTHYTTPPQSHAPHLYLSELEALIEAPLRSKVWVMHYNEDFRAMAKEAGFQCTQTDPLFI